MFTKKNEFWHDDLCLDLVSGSPGERVRLYSCHGLGGNQKWTHERVSHVAATRQSYNSVGTCLVSGIKSSADCPSTGSKIDLDSESPPGDQ